ncbi:MAG TPA: hypothetical protein VF530_03850 [Planctomycetota bacterium]
MGALLAPAVVLGALAARADVTVFVSKSPPEGSVLVLDTLGREEWPPSLEGIVLLPFDVQGRTHLDELRPDRPRIVSDVPGATRVRLPRGRGSLYHYRRATGGGAAFGYFVVEPAGRARALLERPGTGALGRDDPFLGHVSVDPRGEALLLATVPQAGGDLLQVDLVRAEVTNRTAARGPLRFHPQGLVLLSGWGLALADGGPLRFTRQQGADAQPVPLATGWPAWLGVGAVWSADESRVAFVGGEAPTSARVCVVGPGGEARWVSQSPRHLSGAGFLPEEPAGPTLALSTDGSLVAWRSEGVYREGWVSEVARAGTVGELQITHDDNFEDTLNDTGVIAFHAPRELTLLVGEDEGQGLVHADLFRIGIGTGGELAITALSGTNEEHRRPFGYGRLALRDGLLPLPGPPAWLLRVPGDDDGDYDDDDEGELLWVDLLQGSRQSLLRAVGPIRRAEVEPGVLVALLASTHAAQPDRLVRLQLEPLQHCSLSLPTGARLAQLVLAGGEIAGVLARPEGELLWSLDEDCLGGALLSDAPARYGPTLAYSLGVLHATAQVLGSWSVLTWVGGRPSVLRSGLPAAVLLPGS